MAAVWRGVKMGLVGLVALLTVLALAWGASNAVDDAPQPEPDLLRLPPASAGSRLFFQLQGVMAAPGESPEAVGRQDWQRLQTLPPPDLSASAPMFVGRLDGFKAGPLSCLPPEDCQQRLSSAPEAIAQQLQPMALLGERCQAALAEARYEEPRAPVMNLNAPLPSFQGAVNCAKWFKGQALLAAQAGDRARALSQMASSRQLLDALLAGTESLIGKMIAAALVRGHLDAVTAVGLLRPAWAADLAPMAAAWPAGALDAKRWIVTEHAFSLGTVDAAFKNCGELEGLVGDRLLWLACKTAGIGLLPHATRHALDDFWLQEAQRAQQGLDTALDHALAVASQPAPSLAWRNTLGMRLVDVARPAWATYYARQADMELQRQAVALFLAAQVQQVPAADRNAWLDRQGLTARVRSRLNWEEGGQVLQARPWQAELPGTDPRRNPWRMRAAL